MIASQRISRELAVLEERDGRRKMKAGVRKKDIDELGPPNPPITTTKSFISLSDF